MFFFPAIFLRPSKSAVLIDRTTGTNIGDMPAGLGLAGAFDGITTQGTGPSGSAGKTGVAYIGGPGPAGDTAYVGKTLASQKVFGKAIVYGSSNKGFSLDASGMSVEPSITLTIYGKQGSAPANATNGTILATSTFMDTANESFGRTLTSTDLVTGWDHLWVVVQWARRSGDTAATTTLYVAELQLFEWL